MNIAGVRDHEGHGSSAQKSIWHCLMMLSPFEPVAVDVDGFDEKTVLEGERDFYQFMKTLYQELYACPGKYAIPTAAYDAYIQSKTAAPESNTHHNDAKECTLRNAFQQAIQFYPDYFYALGLAGKICPATYSLMITRPDYERALKSLNRPHIQKEKTQRVNAVAGLGVAMDEAEDTYYFSCDRAPKMFLGLHVLCAAPESKYKHMNYLRLDYTGYARGMPGIHDVKLSMGKEHADSVTRLLNLLDGEKLKYTVKPLRNITSSHGWKVDCLRNGKSFFGFFAEPDYLAVYIYFGSADKISEFSKALQNSDTALFAWFCGKFPERLCKCPNNRAVTFGDVKRRICGMSNKAEIINPDTDDVEKSTAIIQALLEGGSHPLFHKANEC